MLCACACACQVKLAEEGFAIVVEDDLVRNGDQRFPVISRNAGDRHGLSLTRASSAGSLTSALEDVGAGVVSTVCLLLCAHGAFVILSSQRGLCHFSNTCKTLWIVVCDYFVHVCGFVWSCVWGGA